MSISSVGKMVETDGKAWVTMLWWQQGRAGMGSRGSEG